MCPVRSVTYVSGRSGGKDELVQHTIAGPTPTGGHIEIMYVANGTIQGLGSSAAIPQVMVALVQVAGDWTIDESEKICTAMKIASSPGTMTILPSRCQFWFKLGEMYFLSDSDSDRRAKVLRRAIKQ